MRRGKYLIICLVVVLVFAFTGCARNNVIDNNSSTLSDKTGVELPEQDFDLEEESKNSENTNINDEDDDKTSSSEDKQNSSSENTNTTSSQPDDETSSEVVDDEEDTSSDDISKPTKGDDGSIELPFDKW